LLILCVQDCGIVSGVIEGKCLPRRNVLMAEGHFESQYHVQYRTHGMNGVSADKHVRYWSMVRCEKDAEGLHVRRLNPSRIAAQDPACWRGQIFRLRLRLCESGAGFSWTSASMTSVIVTLRGSFVLPLSTSQSGSSRVRR
jgi:hypothetical protein